MMDTRDNTAVIASAAAKQSPLIALLEDRKFLTIDGALGTELETRGCQLGTSDKLWSAKVLLENPQLIYQVHLDYFRVGADFIITASYQGSVASFMRYGLTESAAHALIAKCVELAKQARIDYLHEIGDKKTLLIAGSVGPFGTFLADGSEYRGDYERTHDEYCAFHRPRIQTLIAAGVDILAIETIPSASEIHAMLQLLATEFPTITAYISFSLRDGQHLCDGTPLASILPAINNQPQIVAVGVNCYALDKVTDALITLRAHTNLALLVYPNSGERYDPVAKVWVDSPATNLPFHEYIDEWIECGAKMIGGCCRTNPQIIANIANKLNAIRSTM